MPIIFVAALSLAAPLLAAATDDPASRSAPPALDARYLAIDPIDVPIMDGTRIAGRLRITMALEFASAAQAQPAAARAPVLRQQLWLAASDFGVWQSTAHIPIDAAQLHRQLQSAVGTKMTVRLLRIEAQP